MSHRPWDSGSSIAAVEHVSACSNREPEYVSENMMHGTHGIFGFGLGRCIKSTETYSQTSPNPQIPCAPKYEPANTMHAMHEIYWLGTSAFSCTRARNRAKCTRAGPRRRRRDAFRLVADREGASGSPSGSALRPFSCTSARNRAKCTPDEQTGFAFTRLCA